MPLTLSFIVFRGDGGGDDKAEGVEEHDTARSNIFWVEVECKRSRIMKGFMYVIQVRSLTMVSLG
jgi:hypothetical protein